MRLAILVNSGAGGLDRAGCEERVQQIRAAFDALEVRTEIFVCSPARLTRAARSLASHAFDAVVAAGGDGTVNAVAAGLAGTSMPLAVLPFGTLNHFAKDLGMPLEHPAAAAAIVNGPTEQIDIGEINGRVFVNNSSIGLYPEALRLRERERRRGRSKLSAMLVAVARVLWRFPLLAVCVTTPARAVTTRTPFVFVGNNEYGTNILSLGRRAALDRGTLSVLTLRARSRFHMMWLVARALFGRAEHVPKLETQHVAEASVLSTRRELVVALDGEVVRLAPPLYYRVRPGALRVRRAPREAAREQAAVSAAIGGAR